MLARLAATTKLPGALVEQATKKSRERIQGFTKEVLL